MSRTIQDADLHLWEAYASAGDFGFPEHARMVFHCLSDRMRRARFVERPGDKSDVEGEVERLSDQELAQLLESATELK